jgi:hypothetical protein
MALKIWLSISGQNYEGFVKYLRYLIIVHYLYYFKFFNI